MLHCGQCKSKIRIFEDLVNWKTIFFALTETFLRPDSEITMSEFNVVRADRKSGVGGGVCLFINPKVIYKTLLECMFTKLFFWETKTVTRKYIFTDPFLICSQI